MIIRGKIVKNTFLFIFSYPVVVFQLCVNVGNSLVSSATVVKVYFNSVLNAEILKFCFSTCVHFQ